MQRRLLQVAVIAVGLLGAQGLAGQSSPGRAQEAKPSAPAAGTPGQKSDDAQATPSQPSASPSDLLPEIPPPPKGKMTLMGGTVRKLDRVRDQVVVRIYGGKDVKALFDERTRIYRDGEKATYKELSEGAHVYLDTVLDGSKLFARNIFVQSKASAGESQGQVVRYDGNKGELWLRDRLSSSVLRMQVSPNVEVSEAGRSLRAADLQPGTLVALDFSPDGSGHSVVRKVSVLATPGSSFTFAGRVSHLDMHSGLIVLVDPRDRKNYEVSFDPKVIKPGPELREGADVTATTSFDGRRYVASDIRVERGNQ